jgi:hypothetical protein
MEATFMTRPRGDVVGDEEGRRYAMSIEQLAHIIDEGPAGLFHIGGKANGVFPPSYREICQRMPSS